MLDKDPKKLSTLFDGIAPVYDKINGLLSFNLHKRWNRKLAKSLIPYVPKDSHILDLCAGTGAISKELIALKEIEKVTLLDISPGMLALARGQIKSPKADFVVADALELPFSEGSFDGVTVAYGIRNLPSLSKGFQEVHRVLRPKGTFAILELTRPSGWFGPFHALYLKAWVPLLGHIASGKHEAYNYLSESVATFTHREKIEEELENSNFRILKVQPLFKGCATLFLSSSL